MEAKKRTGGPENEARGESFGGSESTKYWRLKKIIHPVNLLKSLKTERHYLLFEKTDRCIHCVFYDQMTHIQFTTNINQQLSTLVICK